jgi:hypothetical protein
MQVKIGKTSGSKGAGPLYSQHLLPFESTLMHYRMHRLLRAGLAACTLVTALAPFPVHAAKLADIQAEDLLRASTHVKDMLALTPNQQTLWQQVSSRAAAILRVRMSRREKLQADLKAKLADPHQDLRDLNAGVEADAAAADFENKELRQLVLSVSDALNDEQRSVVAQFMLSQLERVDAPEHAAAPAHERGESPQGGKHHQRQDGMSGSQGGQTRF